MPELCLCKDRQLAMKEDTLSRKVVNCSVCTEPYIYVMQQWQYIELDKPKSERMYIQDIFPNLSPADREIFISGVCGKCWNRLYLSGD